MSDCMLRLVKLNYLFYPIGIHTKENASLSACCVTEKEEDSRKTKYVTCEGSRNRCSQKGKQLTLCGLRDSSFWSGTINLGWSIAYILGPQVIISKQNMFLKSLSLLPRSHIHGQDAGLATDTIRHHSWQSVLVRSFPYCIRNHT